MALPEILLPALVDEAAALVNEYYTKLYRNGVPQTGSRFDNWAGGGDRVEVANAITADDLLAVSFLSVPVPAPAIIGLVETRSAEARRLLEEIPTDLDLAAVTADEYETILGALGPASKLWRLLRGTDTYRWGIGPTTASKIMARKRPRLVPIYDSVVGPLMGLNNNDTQWRTWHAALTDGAGLPERLTAIREKSGISLQISDLRTMDVALWMHGKKLGMTVKEDADS